MVGSGAGPIYESGEIWNVVLPLMNKQHGILIRADTQVVDDVYALVWNSQEIRKRLLLQDEPFVYQDLRNDSIVIEASPNVESNGDELHKNGFFLFGKRFYGNALIIAEEERDSPRISPQEIAHVIRFFQGGEA
jgi:hypothetical protein